MAKDKIDEEFLIRELQKLRNNLVKDFKKLESSRNTSGIISIKLLEARTDKLLALQYAIKRLDMIIPVIKESITNNTGDAWIYLRVMPQMTTEFSRTLE